MSFDFNLNDRRVSWQWECYRERWFVKIIIEQNLNNHQLSSFLRLDKFFFRSLAHKSNTTNMVKIIYITNQPHQQGIVSEEQKEEQFGGYSIFREILKFLCCSRQIGKPSEGRASFFYYKTNVLVME